MTITLEIKPQVQTKLARQAAAHGMSSRHAASLLEEATPVPSGSKKLSQRQLEITHNGPFQKLCWLCLWTHGSFRPVLDPQSFEAGKILVVCRRQHKPIHMSNRGDLTVDEGRWSA
jgi:hypothetical protein